MHPTQIRVIDIMERTTLEKSGLKAIDLGLRTKWADKNVGATTPEDCGDYYALGEIMKKKEYTWDTYEHCDKSSGRCDDLGSCISQTDYDVAHTNLDVKWQMPTRDQIEELLDNCTSEWTTLNGVSGIKLTGPNGNSIFLPAAGYNYDFDIHYLGAHGYYWSGTLDTDEKNGVSADACSLEFYNGYMAATSHSRYLGFSIRPVLVD